MMKGTDSSIFSTYSTLGTTFYFIFPDVVYKTRKQHVQNNFNYKYNVSSTCIYMYYSYLNYKT